MGFESIGVFERRYRQGVANGGASLTLSGFASLHVHSRSSTLESILLRVDFGQSAQQLQQFRPMNRRRRIGVPPV